jgi:hypothetical protein
MKRLTIVLLALLVAAPAGFARRKKEKAGKVTDLVYTDSKYGFQLKLPEGWKYKTGDAKKNFRLFLVQKNFEVPPDYQDAEHYTQVPRIVVWADTTTLGASAFIDSLVSDSYRSDQKKDIYKEFELINEGSAGSGTYREALVPRGRKTIRVGDLKGFRWVGKCTYMKEVALSASDTGGGKRVRGAYSGTVTAIKKNGSIVIFHLMCEDQYYGGIDAMLTELVNSIEFNDSDKESGD